MKAVKYILLALFLSAGCALSFPAYCDDEDGLGDTMSPSDFHTALNGLCVDGTKYLVEQDLAARQFNDPRVKSLMESMMPEIITDACYCFDYWAQQGKINDMNTLMALPAETRDGALQYCGHWGAEQVVTKYFGQPAAKGQ